MDASLFDYTVTAAGLDAWEPRREQIAESPVATVAPACAASPAPSQIERRLPDVASGYRSGPSQIETGPTRPRVKKSRYTERQQALRGLSVREFIRGQYLPSKRLSVSTIDNLNVLLSHLARCRGQTFVRDLSDELLQTLLDYFLTLIADQEMGPSQANKNLRHLKAVGNFAHSKQLLKNPIAFNAFLDEPRPSPKALTPEEYWKIGQAARAVTGSVCGVPAGVWWFAWYLTMSRVGNRLTAMMYAGRGDYQHGVLHLLADNQKQGEDQRLQLPDYARPAIEDLLAAHDQARLFPWPFDKPLPGKKQNWKTLFNHFKKSILKPAGIVLKKGVLTRVFRQTAGTWIEELGGSGMKQLGHSTPGIFKKHYQDRSRIPVTTGALLIPEDRPPAPPPGKQQVLFQTEEPQ